MARFAGIAGWTLLALAPIRLDGGNGAAAYAGGLRFPAADPVGARMSGGGSLTTDDRFITHGFELHCDADDPPNSLDVEWDGNRFHLAALQSVRCSDDPDIEPEGPVAAFDTVQGQGRGRFNDEDAVAEWTFTDAGAAGVEDRAAITIRNATGDIVLQVSGTLTYGNHEAHE